MRLANVLLGLALFAAAPAQAAEYRVFTLNDGRVFVADTVRGEVVCFDLPQRRERLRRVRRHRGGGGPGVRPAQLSDPRSAIVCEGDQLEGAVSIDIVRYHRVGVGPRRHRQRGRQGGIARRSPRLAREHRELTGDVIGDEGVCEAIP